MDIITEMFRDYALFARTVVPEVVPKKFCRLHYRLFDILYRKPPRVLIIAPRGIAKTTIVSTIGSLHDLAYDREDMILLIKQTQEHAKRDLRAISRVLKHGEQFKAYFGEFEFEKDAAQEIVVKHVATGHRTAILTFGMEQDVRGATFENKRPTKIVLDDCETRKNTMTPEMRTKIQRVFSEDIEPAADPDKGAIIMVGTVPHYDSVMWRIKTKSEQGKLDWEVVFSQVMEDGEPIWPEMYSKARIERIKRGYAAQGLIRVFYQEYMNVPITDEERKLSEFLFYDALPTYDAETRSWTLNGKKLRRFIGVDPSLGTGESQTGIVVLGIDEARNRYVLETRSGNYGPLKTIEALFDLDRKWRPNGICIEEVGMQTILMHWLKEVQIERNHFLPLVHGQKEVRPIMSKEERIHSRLQGLIEAGKLYVRKEQTALTDELMTFPRGARKDLLDALVYADTIAYPPPSGVITRVKETLKRRAYDWRYL